MVGRFLVQHSKKAIISSNLVMLVLVDVVVNIVGVRPLIFLYQTETERKDDGGSLVV